MAETTVAHVVQAMHGVIRSRHEAADLLEEVACDGRCGMYPQHISATAFGQACVRMLVNCDEPDAFDAFLKGVEEARRARRL